ncbi:MAG: trypsin-like peptidase domain-containing protein [Lachnospiraceae bacterium]|nr:trypsin-like peptidase domain-containing protein [Lachnospiraceae bacterium]
MKDRKQSPDAEKAAGQSYIRETIRRKPVNKSKVFRRTLLLIIMAVVFGAIACLTFLLMEPVINGVVNPEKPLKISFPEEEVPVDQFLTEETKAQKEQEDQEQVLQAAREEAAKEIAQQQKEQSAKQAAVKEESGLERYAKTYEELSDLARSAQSYLVTVVSSTSAEGWLLGNYEQQESCSGMIVADNSLDFLVLADLSERTGNRYVIRFHDGTSIERPILARDNQTGLAVFAVPKEELSDSTVSAVTLANLGSSVSAYLVGKPVIAVGSPQGIADSVCYGVVNSNNAQYQVTDANYGVLLTDINGSDDASGALIDLDGNVVGFINRGAQDVSSSDGIAALGITDIKNLIAKLSNNEEIVYLGVRGMGVTQDVHNQAQIPFGAFVTDVEPSSPAMQAGIQNGDIIVEIGNGSVSSFRELGSQLLTLQASEQPVRLLRYDGTDYREMIVTVMLEVQHD